MEIQQKVYEVVADVFSIPIEKIREEMTTDDIEKWDSLQQLNLIMALENKFNIRLGMDDTFNIKSIKSIVEIVKNKL